MTDSHIVASFDENLNDLRKKIVQMGNLVEEQFTLANRALTDKDKKLAEEVRKDDKAIDQLELEIEKFAVEVIALRAPVADDLREVISSIKISTSLERMGDYAKNMAKRLSVLNQIDHLPGSTTILSQMVKITQEMLLDVLDAYVKRDTSLAIEVWNRDQEVDSLYDILFRDLLTYMMEKPQYITSATHLLFIAKNIERAGDQTTNIAEIVYYITEGELLELKRPKKDDTSYVDVGISDTKNK
ncbi:phosphate signaling complex protein PhoU [Emcibacter sp.]|uniref:phosphate signaling complex protein PhoU n=1 Tax=Emcibacter sp. TaxID=1979954 RepID=UPI003A933E99